MGEHVGIGALVGSLVLALGLEAPPGERVRDDAVELGGVATHRVDVDGHAG